MSEYLTKKFLGRTVILTDWIIHARYIQRSVLLYLSHHTWVWHLSIAPGQTELIIFCENLVMGSKIDDDSINEFYAFLKYW